ncbi:precursor of CEP5-like [Telopea speciosissima]|uniref:precursor of CEP5-like n=1 Tax=Telopea speciosissima TaxID=54955 RepID=UPI001CC52D00|nr:precursor of CEP5-like [Telopea speciosissima]
MSKVKFIFASVLLLVFVFSHAVNSVEGRRLLTTPNREKSSHETASRKVGGENTMIMNTLRGDLASKTMAQLVSNKFGSAATPVHIVDINEAVVDLAVPLHDDSPPPPPGHTEGFRPTAPGHSPGIGHSVQN